MSSKINFAEDIKPLKNSPSAHLWDIEIRKLLGGRRAFMVRKRHGGAQAYIEVLIAESANADLARSAFNDALRNFVQEWQTAKPETEYYISGLLDLLISYTPAAGSVKLLAHINRWGRFGKNVFTQGDKRIDLHLKALEALQKYFPVASLEDGLVASGLRAYINILKAHLSDPTYCGHALRRLIELEELGPLSPELVNAIRHDIGVLRDVIPPFLTLVKRASVKRDLAILYIQGLAAEGDVNEQFRQAAKNCRARFELRERAPVIYTADGEEIEFHFTAEELEEYARSRAQEMQQRKITQLLRGLADKSDIDRFTSIVEAKLGTEPKEWEELEAMLGDQGYHLIAPAVPTLYLPDVEKRLGTEPKDSEEFEPVLDDESYRLVAPAMPALYLPGGAYVPLRLQPSSLDKCLLLYFGRDQARLIHLFREKLADQDDDNQSKRQE